MQFTEMNISTCSRVPVVSGQFNIDFGVEWPYVKTDSLPGAIKYIIFGLYSFTGFKSSNLDTLSN